MEIFLIVLSVAAVFWAIWSKAASNQRNQDEVVYLEEVVKGLDAALKLKRLQERADDEQAAQDDLETAETIRRKRDAASSIGFLRDGVRGPGHADPPADGAEVPSTEAPAVPGSPEQPVPRKP